MKANGWRGLLMAAGSALVLTSASVLAQEDAGTSGNDGAGDATGGNGGGNGGVGQGGPGSGGSNAGSSNPGNSDSSNSSPGNSDSSNSSSGDSDSGNSDSGGGAGAGSGGSTGSTSDTSSSGDTGNGGGVGVGGDGGVGVSVGGSTGGSGGQGTAGSDAGAPASGSAGGGENGTDVAAPTPGGATGSPASLPAARTAGTAEPAAPGRSLGDPSFTAEDLVASMPPLAEWSLADFSGKRVIAPSGAGIGVVEGVVVDIGDAVYLVTALDSHDVDGEERLIPIREVRVDAPSQSLVLSESALTALPTMADLASVASAFMMVESDAKLRSLMHAIGEP